MRKWHRHIMLFTGIFWLFCSLHAQKNPQPYFKNYSTEHGLPSPEVYCAFEDSKGYMWFGTDNGASKFDGYEFKNFGAQEGLTSNVVFDIFEDRKGRIWFGTMTAEAFIYDGVTISAYRYNDLIKGMDYSGGSLAHLGKDETTTFELRDFGIVRIDSSGRVETIQGNLPSSYLVYHLKEFSETIHGPYNSKNILTQTDWNRDLLNRSVKYFEVIDHKNQWTKQLPGSVKPGGGIDVQKLRNNNLLIHFENGLHCFSDSIVLWSKNNFPGTNEIIESRNGKIWLCLNKGGGFRKYNNIEALRTNNYESFLEGFSASNYIRDSKGGSWLITLDQGIFYSSHDNLLCYNKSWGLPTNFISNITFKNHQELFVGCNDGEIIHINDSLNQIIQRIPKLWGHDKYSLHFDKREKALYVGLSKWEKGKWFYPNKHDETIQLTRPYPGIDMHKVVSKDGGKLLGVNTSGVLELDIKTNSVQSFLPYDKPERTFAICIDSKRKIWIGNARGLFEFRENRLIKIQEEHPMFHNRIEDIEQMSDSTIVLGSKGFGIGLWKNNKIVQITTEDGLTSNMLEDIFVDKKDNIWAGTLNGLNKITIDRYGKPKIRSFNMANGLPSNEIYQIKFNEDQLWLCTAGGLVKFKEPKPKTVVSPPKISEIFINDSLASKAIDQQFPYSKNNVAFHFAAINFRMDGKIPYRYRIDEDSKWQMTQNRIAIFSSLNPLDYKFEVQAQNEDGFWSESATYPFNILPPWWKTWWFRLIGALVLAFAGFMFFRYRLNALQKKYDTEQQLISLEKSALRAQMNPHFIFNCLNSIQNFILKNDQKNAVSYLAKFAKLVRLNLHASIEGRISLEEEIRLLDNYLALEQERFDHKFDYQIKADKCIQMENVKIPPMLVQPFVENAILHGVKDLNRQGNVIVHFRNINNEFSAIIRDNGRGIHKNDMSKNGHKSVGMLLTNRRMALYNPQAEVPVFYSTLADADGNKIGTEVLLKITPLVKHHENNQGHNY